MSAGGGINAMSEGEASTTLASRTVGRGQRVGGVD